MICHTLPYRYAMPYVLVPGIPVQPCPGGSFLRLVWGPSPHRGLPVQGHLLQHGLHEGLRELGVEEEARQGVHPLHR